MDFVCRHRDANPERLPRRIIRLLHRVTRIEFDICPTEEAARNREELLICVLKPRFNGAGKVWPSQPSLGLRPPSPALAGEGKSARHDFFRPAFIPGYRALNRKNMFPVGSVTVTLLVPLVVVTVPP